MSLVTRGLGEDQKLVTAGLGGSSFIEFIGCVAFKTLDITTSALRSVGLDTAANKTMNLSNKVKRAIDFKSGASKGLNIITDTSKTPRKC